MDRHGRRDGKVWLGVALGWVLLLVAGAAAEERAQKELQVQLAEELRLGEADRKALAEPVSRYAARTRDREQLRAALRDGQAQGCRGECLAALAGSLADAVEVGADPHEARAMAGNALAAAARDRERSGGHWGDAEFGAQIRTHMEQRLQERNRRRVGQPEAPPGERGREPGWHAPGEDETRGRGGRGGGRP